VADVVSDRVSALRLSSQIASEYAVDGGALREI
jgi:hypothetical protein